MLSTSSSTSPGLPSTAPMTTTATPVAAEHARTLRRVSSASGQSTCCSRWSASRYAAPTAPPRARRHRAPSNAGEKPTMPRATSRMTRLETYRITIYHVPDPRRPARTRRRRLPPAARRSAPASAGSCTGARSRPPAVGITPAQHQLMLAIRGHAGRDAPTIGDVAEALLLRHHSAVGLVDRAVDAGLVVRGTRRGRPPRRAAAAHRTGCAPLAPTRARAPPRGAAAGSRPRFGGRSCER